MEASPQQRDFGLVFAEGRRAGAGVRPQRDLRGGDVVSERKTKLEEAYGRTNGIQAGGIAASAWGRRAGAAPGKPPRERGEGGKGSGVEADDSCLRLWRRAYACGSTKRSLMRACGGHAAVVGSQVHFKLRPNCNVISLFLNMIFVPVRTTLSYSVLAIACNLFRSTLFRCIYVGGTWEEPNLNQIRICGRGTGQPADHGSTRCGPLFSVPPRPSNTTTSTFPPSLPLLP